MLKKHMKIMSIIIILLLFSCKYHNHNSISEINLIENKIEQTDYFISLPENYNIYLTESTIWIENSEKYIIGTISMFNNSPSPVANNFIFIENTSRRILDIDREWKIYALSDKFNGFIAEIIIVDERGKFLHFCTTFNDKEEIYKTINILSTLRK